MNLSVSRADLSSGLTISVNKTEPGSFPDLAAAGNLLTFWSAVSIPSAFAFDNRCANKRPVYKYTLVSGVDLSISAFV